MPTKKQTLLQQQHTEAELSLGDLIRRRRREKGYNQTQAGEILGVNQSTVAKWEVGRDNPGPEKLPLIADFLGLPFQEVIAIVHGGHDPEWATSVAELRGQIAALEQTVTELRQQMAQVLDGNGATTSTVRRARTRRT